MEYARNIRTEEKLGLKQANKEWIDCITRDYLPKWLKGSDISINDVCKSEYEKMSEADKAIYGELPFKLEPTD